MSCAKLGVSLFHRPRVHNVYLQQSHHKHAAIGYAMTPLQLQYHRLLDYLSSVIYGTTTIH
jgi:hypothetical protein